MVRLWLDVAVGPGVSPFVVYAPAVLISALAAGRPSGVLALAYGGVLAWWLFLPPYFSFALDDPAQGVNLALYVVSSGLMVWLADTCRRAFHAIAEEQGMGTLLLCELRHRMKNTFAVIQATVSQSLRASPEEARKINGRISAVLASDELVAGGGLYRTDLRSILTSELEPYGSDRFELHGDPVTLAPDHARALALVVHELATNAAKYGALSVPEGRLQVSWSATPERVQVTWSECGGPPVPDPAKRGFGSSFTERLLAGVGGIIAREFQPAGLVCTIEWTRAEPGRSGAAPPAGPS
jgi:two-component sensor histidine kinase